MTEDCVVDNCSENILKSNCISCDSNDGPLKDHQTIYCSSLKADLDSTFQQFQNSNIKKVLWRIFYKKRSIIIPFFWGILVGVTMTAVLFQQHVLHQSSFLDSDNYSPLITNKNNNKRLESRNFMSKLIIGTTSSSSTITDKVHV